MPGIPTLATRALSRLCVGAAAAALFISGCGGSDEVPPPPPPVIGSATLGPAGGTVEGPDGVQVIVPAGALVTPTTIRIARSSAGAPPPPEDVTFTAIYEITPHDLEFAVPITVRLPSTANIEDSAAPLRVMFASPAEAGWFSLPSSAAGPGFVTVQRTRLSWYGPLPACSFLPGERSLDPYKCEETRILPPAVVLTPSSAGSQVVYDFFISAPSTIEMRFDLLGPTDCPQGTVQVFRSSAELPQLRQTVRLIDRRGVATVRVAADQLDDPFVRAWTNVLIKFTCPRANGKVGTDGGYLRFLVDYAPPPSAPTISQQPQGQTLLAGQAATFAVRASASETLEVTWQRSNDNGTTWSAAGPGSAVPGGSDLTLTAASADDGAQFRAEACNVAGGQRTCISSSTATLRVTALVAPTFSMQPVDVSVVAGQTASFTVTADGVPAPAVRWQSAEAGTSNFADLTGEAGCLPAPAPANGTRTLSTCTISATSPSANGRRIRAVAENPAAPGGVPSAAATLSITSAQVAPTIVTPPQAVLPIAAGDSVQFSVVATGTAPLTYIWQLNGVNLPGVAGQPFSVPFDEVFCTGTVAVTGATLRLENVNAGCNSASLHVVVSNGIGTPARSDGLLLPVVSPSVQTFAAGLNYSMAIKNGQLYAWGRNDVGQLGDGTTDSRSSPVPITLASGVTATGVSAAVDHTLAKGSDGKLYAWGSNAFGQLGDGTTTARIRPHVVALPAGVAPVDISAGFGYSLATGSDGRLYAWGKNDRGQLGDGTTTGRTLPVDVPLPAGMTLRAVFAAENFSVAVASDGSLLSWGENLAGLGQGSLATLTPTVALLGGLLATGVSPGLSDGHILALGVDLSLYAWGDNSLGELGDGKTTNFRTVPGVVQIPGANYVVAAAAGNYTSFAIGSNGRLYAWGWNQDGQLGDGTTTDRSVPVEITLALGGIKAVAVRPGSSHTLALGSDGILYAWGKGFLGALGDGNSADRDQLIPMAVPLP